MAELAGRLMDAFAAAVGPPDGWFAPSIDRHGSAMRMVRYPHVDRTALPGQLRAGAHTDYGTLTILRQDAAPGGLEVQTTDGRWVPIPFAPGTYVVNIAN